MPASFFCCCEVQEHPNVEQELHFKMAKFNPRKCKVVLEIVVNKCGWHNSELKSLELRCPCRS